MSGTTEIRAKLRVEDAASPTLARIKEAFSGTDKAAASAAGSAVSFARQAAAAAVGFNAAGLVQTARSTATEWMKAAAGPAAMKRQLTSMAMLLQDLPLDKAAAEADELAAAFRGIGRETGTSSAELRGAFSTLTEMGKGSREEIERAKVELGQLAKIAEVLDMPIESAAREVGFLHEGMLKTKGQMFQLLNRTGVFGKDIKKAADSWQKMTEEDRAKRVAYALETTANKIGKLPTTWARVTGQIGNLMEGWKKDFGEPLLEAMVPELEKVVEMLGYGRGEIKLFAKAMGQDVGKWVRDAAKLMSEGFKYVQTHQEEIRKAISEGVEKSKAVVEFILAHKEAIAAAYGVHAVAPSVMKAAGAVSSGVSFASSAATAAGIGGAIGTAATMALFATAVAAWALAVNEFAELVHDAGGIAGLMHGEAERNRQAQEHALRNMAKGTAGRTAGGQLNALAGNYLANTKNVGGNVEEAMKLVAAARAAAHAAGQQADQLDSATQKVEIWNRAMKQGASVEEGTTAMVAAGQQVSASFEAAMRAGNDGAQKYIADLTSHSEGMQKALIQAGAMTAEGFEALAKLVEGSSKDFAMELRAQAKSKSEGSKPAPPTINMTGGQTFKITQDFRDQDPDRVAIALEEGIGRLVTRRVAAGTSSPFGT